MDSNKRNLVLVVDDSPETLGLLNQALEKANMKTLVALEGEQAINIAKMMKPDVILLDAIMPVMDGFQTCEKIKSHSDIKGIPVIFMTGLTDTESIVKGFAVGGVDYLTKPINPIELIARINTHLVNARETLSAQAMLDSTGNNIYVTDDEGKKKWATPEVEKFFEKINLEKLTTKFEKTIANWLKHDQKEGNRCYFNGNGINITIVYQGHSNNNEHHIKIINNEGASHAEIFRQQFKTTPRESDVLIWLAKGKTNREIGEILKLSPRTVNKHLEQIFKKLAVDNRTSAATTAMNCLQNHSKLN